MRRLILAAAFAVAPSLGMAADLDGVWRTAATDDGAYLEVTLAPCASAADHTCGTITKAFKSTGEDRGYVNLGKPIVESMKSDGGGHYSGGTVWDPQSNKTYNSKMTLKGDSLDVEGCVAFLCSGQDWTRVK